MNTSEPDPQYAFTAPFEGVVTHMYKDTAGVVTCGIGFALFSRDHVKSLPWLPSIPAALADFDDVSQAPAGQGLSFYRVMCHARLHEQSMRAIFHQHMVALRLALRDWELERHPLVVQIALLDMAYNLGVTGLNRFQKLKAALRAHDYERCARECSRKGVQISRNTATRHAFETAATIAASEAP